MNGIDNLPDDLNELARRAATGDAQALNDLLNHQDFHKKVVILCRKARRKCRSQGAVRDLDDLVQETLMRLLQRFQQYRGKSNHDDDDDGRKPLDFYLYKIAKNISLREVEREVKEDDCIEKVDWLLPVLFEPTTELEAELMEVYEKLDPDEQERLKLHLRDLNARQITEELYPSEWEDWDLQTRKNETEKVRRKIKEIVEKIAVALGIHERKKKAGA